MTAIIEEFNQQYDRWANLSERQYYENLRKQFVNDYSLERIRELSLEEYLIGKKGIGSSDSFCRRMRYDLQGLASLGNVRFDIFGVYYDSNGNPALSKTFKNMFVYDIESAFIYIKNEIILILTAASEDDYKSIISNRLNSSFRYKLITVYYPEKFIPVVTDSVLNAYCDGVCLSINPNEPMIYRNLQLKAWKDRNPETSDWSNDKMMFFCDWLWRSGRYYSYGKQETTITKDNQTELIKRPNVSNQAKTENRAVNDKLQRVQSILSKYQVVSEIRYDRKAAPYINIGNVKSSSERVQFWCKEKSDVIDCWVGKHRSFWYGIAESSEHRKEWRYDDQMHLRFNNLTQLEEFVRQVAKHKKIVRKI